MKKKWSIGNIGFGIWGLSTSLRRLIDAMEEVKYRAITHYCRYFSFLLLMLLLTGCHSRDSHQHEEKNLYTCPMHPDIIRENQGKCPICGMDLVLKINNKNLEETNSLVKGIEETDLAIPAHVKLIKPEEKEVDILLKAPGYITYDTRRIHNVTARFSGRIEKLYVKTAFQPVEKGQKLMDIYSPEILTAQQNLIYLIDHDPAAAQLVQGAKQKLILLGLTTSQVEKIMASKKANASISIYSPLAGHLHESTGQGMEVHTTNNNFTDTELSVREGMYVEQGQSIFNIADVHEVWAVLNIYAHDIATIKLHSPVTLTIDGVSEPIEAAIDFIEPLYHNNATTMNVRVYLNNHHHHLKIGSLVQAEITSKSKKGLWLPKTAVVDLGQRKVVWASNGKTLIPRVVITGNRLEKLVEIMKGVTSADLVAENAQYISDSESFITVN